ncbi:hypothetical protein EVAR_33776_1 [Eumeta japonica]|uniref:Uncharacterized protein n=1 Tax=Eumeta variegata TaxID=151549 RepID=A0A4C1VUD8_EUMVA|nr:hypothetical protein EVAR_33776_1 [Eumeta japonica]
MLPYLKFDPSYGPGVIPCAFDRTICYRPSKRGTEDGGGMMEGGRATPGISESTLVGGPEVRRFAVPEGKGQRSLQITSLTPLVVVGGRRRRGLSIGRAEGRGRRSAQKANSLVRALAGGRGSVRSGGRSN